MPAELESATTVDSAGNTVTAASATAMSGGKLETLCVAIVDPISTGACLAKHLSSQGYRLCRVFSDTIPDSVKALVAAGLEVDWEVTIQHEGRVASTLAALRGVGVTHLLVGSEPGVSLHAELSAAFAGGAALSLPREALELRRNKYLQSEAIRSAGCDAAVVKPVEGAGSDGVTICNSAAEVRLAFGKLEGTKNILGLDNYAVLCQEYLEGDEWVVDTVSRAGEHKVVALWKYDKRDYHGSPVVYHGMRLHNVEADEPLLRGMVAYVTAVLDALGITDGAMHSEIMATARGPVLVEVNCRLHGGEGIWLPIAEACLGYTQVSALCDSAFAPPAFASLPATPRSPLLKHGAWVTIRSPADGTITAVHHEKLARIRALPSFLGEYCAPCIKVGCRIRQTVDATTVHADAATLEADYRVAQQLIDEGLFAFTPAAAGEKDVVRVETPKGPRFSYQLSEQEQVQNSLWGLQHIWRPLEENSGAVPLRKLRAVRRSGWRF
ncbi:hypothetical protein EMIHUDRAFT_465353 [Emiliania huxleyi CCMP1516]|uniref:ATP-grasp domain-containing protein n=2 Tax=Emiliania huxleyi TaxID=2903 RepID=A0A0D3IER8_EMIH1|nr:hypothetical protein EMIHUDRAFT_465353 [Emiliania huxleyi CCMP1516]EOD09753.1 hypothetical protein EMIHUDRAFT_465353 [Emiliania huxleyi CCMP1516]|eukprot:XP_005762182.1 hypothetical protein EMIHUDRAFT_465353 [Emiliania huxleyi CCMP1516]